MNYTDRVVYITPPEFKTGLCDFKSDFPNRTILDPDSPMYSRAKTPFSQRGYLYPCPPLFLGTISLNVPTEEMFVLTLVIKTPASDWLLPKELHWTMPFIWSSLSYQKSAFPDFEKRFFYLTVRSGPVRQNQDDFFHVDGFQGHSIPRHLPEQNYLWADSNPTLFSIQPYFVEDLDASKHNINDFFDKNTIRSSVFTGVDKGIYCFDPYHVHARPSKTGPFRSMIRLNCSTVEIRDDSNTPNPWLPLGPYGKPDPRNFLWDYPIESPELKFGLKKL